MNLLRNVLIVLVLAYLVFDGFWKAQFSDDDSRMEQMRPWEPSQD